MEVILLLGEVCPLLPPHYWQEGRRGHAGRREAKTLLSHRPLVVFQHRASLWLCFNIGPLVYSVSTSASGGSVSCRKVPPCYWCLHTRHTTRNMCPLFIQQILIHFPKSTIHDSFLLLAPTTPGLNIRLKPIDPFAPSWI